MIAGIALIVAVLLSGVGLAVFYFSHERPPILDKATLCPVDGPRSVTVVLVDSSDELPAPARREVEQILRDEAEGLPVYGLIDIRVLDPAIGGSRSIFQRCNPGDGSNLSEWTANPRLARQRWMEEFQQPVTEALKNSLTSSESETSPIMAAIQDIALRHFTGRAASQIPKSLIVISDMVEHGDDYSQYSGDLSFARFEKSPAYRRFNTNLNDAAVAIKFVERLSSARVNSVQLIEFWREWIQANNGRYLSAVRLQGAG